MPEEPEKGAQVIDLMEALRASLEKKPKPKPAAAAQEKPAEERKAAAARKPPKRAQQGAEAPARRAARK